jgi:hypothetical protein
VKFLIDNLLCDQVYKAQLHQPEIYKHTTDMEIDWIKASKDHVNNKSFKIFIII